MSVDILTSLQIVADQVKSKLLGQKIWEILVHPEEQTLLRDVITDGKTKKQDVQIVIRNHKRILLQIRPVKDRIYLTTFIF